jgi:hypothetical protein
VVAGRRSIGKTRRNPGPDFRFRGNDLVMRIFKHVLSLQALLAMHALETVVKRWIGCNITVYGRCIWREIACTALPEFALQMFGIRSMDCNEALAVAALWRNVQWVCKLKRYSGNSGEFPEGLQSSRSVE